MAVASTAPYATICISLQTDNHTNTPHHSIFTGGMLFLMPNQQCQSNNNNDRLTAFDPGQPG